MAIETAQKRNLKPLWIALAFIALITIVLLPASGDLPVVGQRALAILAFAVILWVTEAVSYPVSSAMILAAIAAQPALWFPHPLHNLQCRA